MAWDIDEAKGYFMGHQIVALWSMWRGSKLYVDGKVVDTSSTFNMKGMAFLRGSIEQDGIVHIVEVYARADSIWSNMRLEIEVDRSVIELITLGSTPN